MSNQETIAELDRMIEEAVAYNESHKHSRTAASIAHWSGYICGLDAAKRAVIKIAKQEAAHA